MGVEGTCLPVGIDSQVGTSTCKKDIAKLLERVTHYLKKDWQLRVLQLIHGVPRL
jgi:hypothetical protein